MKSFVPALCIRPLVAVVAGWGMGSAGAQVPAQPNSGPVFTLRPAVVISMPTEAGKVYQLQASSNLEAWQDQGEPVFGLGTPMRQPMISEGQQFFRLRVLTEPALGPAPWSPVGHAYQLNEGQRIVQTRFVADGCGIWQDGDIPADCTWTWQRTSPSTARARLTLAGGSREVLDFTYSAPQAGRFVRWVYAENQLAGTTAGSFGPQAAPSPAGSDLVVPVTLAGRAIAFCDQPSGGSLTMATQTAGTRLLEGGTLPFNGSWLVTGHNSGRITATFSPTHGEEYRLTFTTSTCGRFTRQTFTEGLFRDADEGTFCLTNPP